MAWDTALTAKQSGLYHTPRMHAYVVSHEQHVPEDIVGELAAGARAFFYTATPASSLGARAAELPSLPSGASHVLTGKHWLAGNQVAGQLALLGFLPHSWACTCDLYSWCSGRALLKANELLCWWHLSDRVS